MKVCIQREELNTSEITTQAKTCNTTSKAAKKGGRNCLGVLKTRNLPCLMLQAIRRVVALIYKASAYILLAENSVEIAKY